MGTRMKALSGVIVACLVVVGAPALTATAAGAAAGDVISWGENGLSQLGDGTTTDRQDGVTTQTGSVIDLAGGRHHVIAALANGTVASWGWNSSGQLGDDSLTNRSTPVEVAGLSNVSAVGAGHYHSLAVSGGDVWAWGRNSFGQLGQPDRSNRDQPVKVPSISTATMVAGGREHSAALLGNGTVLTWGNNTNGQLGTGAGPERDQPALVPGLSNVIHLATGRVHSIALTSDGQVWTWGDNNYGQLGDGTTVDRSHPVQVHGLSNVTRVEAFGFHTVALTADGSVWTWGRNNLGQLGDGTEIQRTSPVEIALRSIVAVAVGSGRDYGMAAESDGTVWAWGRNDSAQLGDGTTTQRNSPVVVDSLSNPVELVGGRDYIAARLGGDVEPPAPPPPDPGDLACTATTMGSDLDLEWTAGLGRSVIRQDAHWLATPGNVTSYTVSSGALNTVAYAVRVKIDGVKTDIPCDREGEPPPGPSCSTEVAGSDVVVSWTDGLPKVNMRRNGVWYATVPAGQTSVTVPNGAGDVFSIRIRVAGQRQDLACP